MKQDFDLDVDYVGQQIIDVLTVVDWNRVEGLYVSSSFANESEGVDAERKLDVYLVVTDFDEWYDMQADVVCYGGMNPASIHMTADSGNVDFGEYTMSLVTTDSIPENVEPIRIL